MNCEGRQGKGLNIGRMTENLKSRKYKQCRLSNKKLQETKAFPGFLLLCLRFIKVLASPAHSKQSSKQSKKEK